MGRSSGYYAAEEKFMQGCGRET
jgi:hypothetical protein